jgi:hypothetical protein
MDKKNATETEHKTHHASVKEDPNYKAMLEFVKWSYDRSRFNDHEIRMKTTELLRQIGEME